MIRVLQNWQEVGEAIQILQRQGLPLHHTPQKNWDHFLLYKILQAADRKSKLLDLGCGEGHTLSLLNCMGFSNLDGVDLHMYPRARAKQLVSMLRSKRLRPPFRLHRGDITRTRLDSSAFDMIVSVSTIEHGVDLEKFLLEVARLLRPGGTVFITTDYWQEQVCVDRHASAFNLPWHVFSPSEIQALVDTARAAGLASACPAGVPECTERPVSWHGVDYTFIALCLKKEE